jgi:hypothetical protein
MSVVGEPLVLISKISVTYVCGRRTLSFFKMSPRNLMLQFVLGHAFSDVYRLDYKGSPTTDIGDADLRY